MTRYFITLDEAIELLIKASNDSLGGEILVMNMSACKIVDLANVLIDVYGNKNIKIKEIGIRPGEKLHEELISKYESPSTYQISKSYYLIMPTIDIKSLNEYYDNFKEYKKVDFEVFDSSSNLMNKEEILKRLRTGGFI